MGYVPFAGYSFLPAFCQGNSGAWYIIVQRKFGFNGEIKVEARGLPPGVTAAPLTIPPNVAQGCLIFTCAPDAKGYCVVVITEVTGSSQSSDRTFTTSFALQHPVFLIVAVTSVAPAPTG